MRDGEQRQGVFPPRSIRRGSVGQIPTQFPSGVTISESSHVLSYVESIRHIEAGPICGRDEVAAWTLDNGVLKVKAILMGGSVMSIEKGGQEYLWQNHDGAAYTGIGAHIYPLMRGLIQHGGLRLSAVTAEHGLYYDTDWDVDFAADERGSSIILKIQDSLQNRELLRDVLSCGIYEAPGSTAPMGRYPVTDADFILTITLRPREEFVRLKVALVNTRQTPILSEIWLPQTFPINRDSQIISHQRKRRCKDWWVYEAMLAGRYLPLDMALDADSDTPVYRGKAGLIVGWPPTPISGACQANLEKPLEWPSSAGGILYDYPRRDGAYHAVSFGDGRGAAYVTASDDHRPHYTKLWSWGNPDLYDREKALNEKPPLLGGRAKTEYYEPWGSGFTPAFFEPTEFPPGESSWQALIVPIESGLEGHKDQAELRQTVDGIVAPLVPVLDPPCP